VTRIQVTARIKGNAKRIARSAKFRREAATQSGFERAVSIAAARQSIEWARRTRQEIGHVLP
jgi:hypothetical protein